MFKTILNLLYSLVRVAKSVLHSTAYHRKVAELVLVSVCLGLSTDCLVNSAIERWWSVSLALITAGAYVVINSVLLICLVLENPLPPTVRVLFDLMGALLFLSCGYSILRSWNDIVVPEEILSQQWVVGISQIRYVGLLSMLIGSVYLLDTGLTVVSNPPLWTFLGNLLTPTDRRYGALCTSYPPYTPYPNYRSPYPSYSPSLLAKQYLANHPLPIQLHSSST